MPWTKWGKRRALAKIDLTEAWKALCDLPGWDQVRAGLAETSYREYLSKYIDRPDGVFAPSPDVDAFWRAHMADERQYAADCEAVFGRTIPHVDPLRPSSWRETARPTVASSPSPRRPLPVVASSPAQKPYPPEPRAADAPPPQDDGTNMLVATVAAVAIMSDDPTPASPPAESPSHDAGSSYGGGHSHDSGSYGGSTYGGDSGGSSYDSGGGGAFDSGGGGSSCGGGGGGGD